MRRWSAAPGVTVRVTTAATAVRSAARGWEGGVAECRGEGPRVPEFSSTRQTLL